MEVTMSYPQLLQPIPVPPQSRTRPTVRIVEQPSKLLRYRYSCEGRPGTIPGASSTADNKIPFAIQIIGYEGRVVVLVSCVTKDRPYRPHPHNLVGLNCKKGVCSFETEITANNSTISFPKLAVQCVKKKDVKEALRTREEKKIDPFMTGFDHKNDVKALDLNVVRLCFQVFLVGENRRNGTLTPVVSDPIYNKKTLPDPIIYRLSHCNAFVNGSQEDIILLCTKIIKDDIKIRFFETNNDQVVWEDFGTFHPNHIYNYSAICFRPPKYYNQNITDSVKVSVQLVRPSDNVKSPAVPFEYLPLHTVPGFLKERREKGNPLYDQFRHIADEKKIENLDWDNIFQPTKMPRLETNEFLLVNSEPWPIPHQRLVSPEHEVPQMINNINGAQPSRSRRNSPEELSLWNIRSEDFTFSANVNIDNPSAIGQVLNMDNQISLEPIHISSGDLDMVDVDRLSGSLKEYLMI